MEDQARTRDEAAAMLTSMAAIMGSRLGPAGRYLRPQVYLVEDATTAKTDTSTAIYLPLAFDGHDVVADAEVSLGLMAHELGHFLQPNDEINAVQKGELIPNWLVNLVMDIQDEALVTTLMPSWENGLRKIRWIVSNSKAAEYNSSYSAVCNLYREGKIDSTQALRGAAKVLAFIGRFAPNQAPGKAQPFDIDYAKDYLRMVNAANGTWSQSEQLRLTGFVELLDSSQRISALQLPDKLREIIRLYPELKAQSKARPGGDKPGKADGKENDSAIGELVDDNPIPTQHVVSDEGKPIIAAVAAVVARRKVAPQSALFEQERLVHVSVVAPEPEAVRLARRFAVRWLPPRRTGVLVAPGRLDRMAEARDEEIPFRARGKQGKQRLPHVKAVIAVDVSGSMGRRHIDEEARWWAARLAAQSIALGLKQADPNADLVGILFNDYPHFATSKDDAILFGKRELFWGQHGTNFDFIPQVLARWPEHHLYFITDGLVHEKDVPRVAHAAKKRASGLHISIGLSEEQARLYQGNLAKFCSRVIGVSQLANLPAALASLVPRRN